MVYISVLVLYRLIKNYFNIIFKHKKDLRIKEYYITFIKSLGLKRTAISEDIANKVIKLIINDRNGREKSAEILKI